MSNQNEPKYVLVHIEQYNIALKYTDFTEIVKQHNYTHYQFKYTVIDVRHTIMDTFEVKVYPNRQVASGI